MISGDDSPSGKSARVVSRWYNNKLVIWEMRNPRSSTRVPEHGDYSRSRGVIPRTRSVERTNGASANFERGRPEERQGWVEAGTTIVKSSPGSYGRNNVSPCLWATVNAEWLRREILRVAVPPCGSPRIFPRTAVTSFADVRDTTFNGFIGFRDGVVLPP